MDSLYKWFINRPIIIIFSVWLIIQSAIYLFIGVEYGFEGDKYINDAYLLIDYHSLNFDRLFYSIYSILISFFIKLGCNLWCVIIFQLLLNAFATYVLYLLAIELYKNRLTALVVSLIFIFSFQIQQWNFFLFTESIFISIIIFLYYIIAKFNSAKTRHYLYLSLLIVLLAFSRPSGFFFLAPVFIFITCIIYKEGFTKFFLYPITAIGFIIIINLIYNQTNLLYHYNLSNSKHWIIWGYDFLQIDNFDNSILDYLRLFILRIIYYFSNWRPFFSLNHNLIIIFSLVPIYLLALIGIFNTNTEHRRFNIFIFITIFIFTGFIMLTFVNWHGRFLAVLLPAIIIVSGYGVDYFIEKS